MNSFSDELKTIVKETSDKLKKFTQEEWNFRRAPGKWSSKEILGHLIDSAGNNHQRFVRVQYEKNIPFIIYEQNTWNALQDYNSEESSNLLNLWISYNNHLAHIISRIPEQNYPKTCKVGEDEIVTLEWLVKDYIRHLKHHLNQIYEAEGKVHN